MPPRTPFERFQQFRASQQKRMWDILENLSPGLKAQMEEAERQVREGMNAAQGGPVDPQAEAFVSMLYDAVEKLKEQPWTRTLPGKVFRRFLRTAVTEVELTLIPQRTKAFELLGVRRTDEFEIIKKKYRALARQHHPDLPSGSHDKMQELNHAYEIVCRIKGMS